MRSVSFLKSFQLSGYHFSAHRATFFFTRTFHCPAGKKVSEFAQLFQSYESACALKTLARFHEGKPVYFYEDEIQERSESPPIYKEILDGLVSAIERNDRNQIRTGVSLLTHEMQNLSENDVNVNIHYLLFRLTGLASALDSEADQERIIRFISGVSSDNCFRKGGYKHLERFALEYAAYLSQLAIAGSADILRSVEREIRERYSENLTLQELGKRYYINSSYLGQMFHKKFGMSFKSYLTAYRIRQAAVALLETQKSVSQVAQDVGYRDTDYFVRKFIEVKGCTPSRFRKNRSLN